MTSGFPAADRFVPSNMHTYVRMHMGTKVVAHVGYQGSCTCDRSTLERVGQLYND